MKKYFSVGILLIVSSGLFITWHSLSEPDWEFPEATHAQLPSEVSFAFLGNSITLHEPSEAIGWNHSHGMAAPSSEDDYATLVITGAGAHPESAFIANLYPFETDSGAALMHLNLVEQLASREPEFIILQLGDNVGSRRLVTLFNFWRNYRRLADAAAGAGAKVICVSTFWEKAIVDYAIWEACNAAGGLYVYIGDIYTSADNPDRELRTYIHAGVNRHPQAYGMAQIANRILLATHEFSRSDLPH